MFTLVSKETFQDGQIIFEEESSGDALYLILSGTVEISKTAGGKKQVFDMLHESDIVGELAFLGGIRRTATARAIGETTVGLIDRKSLVQDLEKLSPGFRIILNTVVKRLKNTLDMRSGGSYRPPRVPKTLAVTYDDRKSIVKTYASDISLGGLYVKTDEPLDMGQTFSLKLHIPGLPEPMEIECEVAWARKKTKATQSDDPPGMGVKFMGLGEADSRLLRQYIKTVEKLAPKPSEMPEKDNRILREFTESLPKPQITA